MLDLRWAKIEVPGESGVAAPVLENQRLDSLHLLSAEVETRTRDILLCGHADDSAASELVQVVEAFLPAAAEACDNDGTLPTPVAVALSRMRELLHFRTVARAVREFMGGLLYLALTRTPCEEDVLTWSTRCKLLTFLHAMCDVQARDLECRGEPLQREPVPPVLAGTWSFRRCSVWCATRSDSVVAQRGPRLSHAASTVSVGSARCLPLSKMVSLRFSVRYVST